MRSGPAGRGAGPGAGLPQSPRRREPTPREMLTPRSVSSGTRTGLRVEMEGARTCKARDPAAKGVPGQMKWPTDSAAVNRVPSGAPGWWGTRARGRAGGRPHRLTFPATRPGPASARPAQPSRRCRGLPAAHQHSGARPAESRARSWHRAAFKRPPSAEPRQERAARGRGRPRGGGGGAAEGASERPPGREPDAAQLFP